MGWTGCNVADEAALCSGAKEHLTGCFGQNVALDPEGVELCDGDSAQELMAMSCEELALFKTEAKMDEGNACELSELCHGVGFLDEAFCQKIDPYCPPLTKAELADIEASVDDEAYEEKEDAAWADGKEDNAKAKARCKQSKKAKYKICKKKSKRNKKSKGSKKDEAGLLVDDPDRIDGVGDDKADNGGKSCVSKWKAGKKSCKKAAEKRRKCKKNGDKKCDKITSKGGKDKDKDKDKGKDKDKRSYNSDGPESELKLGGSP